MTAFDVHFHGVRGSLASPGVHTARVGGNTSCVEIDAGGSRIVLDAGTGLRGLGERLVRGGHDPRRKTTILLSHVHWDHIQGLPFFSPIYVPGWEIDVVSGPNGFMPLEQVLRRQMAPPFFPVAFDDLAARVRATDERPGSTFAVGDVTVTMARLNHPDPVYGYRLEWNGCSVVYATDTEHYQCVDPTLRKLAEGADVLIYDAQYTPEEYSGETGAPRVGWGHSTFEAAAALARTAEVGNLVLFHHDPGRSDAQVAAIEERARDLFPRTLAAREGASLDVTRLARDHAAPDLAVARAPLERRPVCLTERNRAVASSARRDEGAGGAPATEEQRGDAPQIRDFATEGKPVGALEACAEAA